MLVKHFSRLSAVLFFIVSLCLPIFSVSAADKSPLRVGDVPPLAALRDLNGTVVRVPTHFRGKVVVLHFWAGGCSSCREELPAMESLHATYGKKGLVILAINVGQRRDTVVQLVRSLGISFPVLLDSDREMAGRYDVYAVPRTYIIDRSGVIRYRILGSANVEMLKKRVLSML